MNIYALELQVKKFFDPLWLFIEDSYLTKGKYPNLGLEKNALFSLEFSIFALIAGLIFACLIIAYHKQVAGKVARTLVENECNSRESAKTLAELGIYKNPLVRNAACYDKALKRYVVCVGKEEYQETVKANEAEKTKAGVKYKSVPEYLIDTKTDRFYIPKELCEDAKKRYRIKGSGTLATTLTIAGLLIILTVLFFTLPTILAFINGLIPAK